MNLNELPRKIFDSAAEAGNNLSLRLGKSYEDLVKANDQRQARADGKNLPEGARNNSGKSHHAVVTPKQT